MILKLIKQLPVHGRILQHCIIGGGGLEKQCINLCIRQSCVLSQERKDNTFETMLGNLGSYVIIGDWVRHLTRYVGFPN